jgi:hypothetical protein
MMNFKTNKKSKEYRKLQKTGMLKLIWLTEINPPISRLTKFYLNLPGNAVEVWFLRWSQKILEMYLHLYYNFNSINNKKNIIYVVNDNVYDCPLDFKGLVESKNIFCTQYRNIYRFWIYSVAILGDLKQGEVSILFRPNLFTPSMQGLSNNKILDAAHKTDIKCISQ